MRLEKLIWLYCLEAGDEGPCSASGGDTPSPEELTMVLLGQGLDVDVDNVQSIMTEKMAISDELASSIEQAFQLSDGWLSN